MQGRTRLTTPPGRSPEPVAWSSSTPTEHYSPGFEVPVEPIHPARGERAAWTLAIVVLVLAVGVLVFQSLTGTRVFDPSLGPTSPPATSGR